MKDEIHSRFIQFPENDHHDNVDVGNDEEEQEIVSDCESSISHNSSDYHDTRRSLFGDDQDLVRLDKGNLIHDVIHNKFLSCLGEVGKKQSNNITSVLAIHKKIWSSNSHHGDSRRSCFEIYRQALKNKYGDDSHMKFAWYGVPSKDDIARIMSTGFGIKDIPINNGVFDDAIHFSPVKFLTQSVNWCVVQEDGLMHMLLCRVLLEKEDIIVSVNSNDPDSKITTYAVRSTKMNTHILPEYVISFKITPLTTSCFKAHSTRSRKLFKESNSPWMTFSSLILALSDFLPPNKLSFITKLHKHLKERKISRHEFIQHLKRLVGLKLLVVIVKLCGTKDRSLLKGQQQLSNLRRALAKSGYQICKINNKKNI